MPPNLMDQHKFIHPLGSAITGGAGLFRDRRYLLAYPIMSVSELEALH
ncbi:hypothetical protein ACFQZT_31455 [Paenibacillus sp. GCM10027628]